MFFSDKYYPGDAKIKNTIAKFIHDEAAEGNAVIVGRGGEVITKSIAHSYHVKLYAPLDWRAQIVSSNEGMNLEEARKTCIENDKRRSQFRDYFERSYNFV